MKITRIIFEDNDIKDKSLAVCSIVLDDSLRLNEIRLYKNNKGFYLVLPSRQDIYQEVQKVNSKNIIELPKKEKEDKPYEEFFFPLENSLYKAMLATVVDCFSKRKENGTKSFRF